MSQPSLFYFGKIARKTFPKLWKRCPASLPLNFKSGRAGRKTWADFYTNRRANQYPTSISIGKQYFPFYLAIIVLKIVKYLIIGLTAKERPVTMATVKAIGFLFSRIMNFSPLCVTPPLHSQPLRLKWSLSVLEIPRFCLIICQTREKHREKKMFKAQQMYQFRPAGVSHNQ